MKVRIEFADDSLHYIIQHKLPMMDCLRLVAEKTGWALSHGTEIREVNITIDDTTINPNALSPVS